MAISIFDLYSIGVGPSSSHTVGPMRASFRFLNYAKKYINQAAFFKIHLYGSLALTGKGHCTDTAVVLGSCGFEPHTIDISAAKKMYTKIEIEQSIDLLGEVKIKFNPELDVVFNYHKTLEEHANGMEFILLDINNNELCRRKYFSIGGGFILDEDEISCNDDTIITDTQIVPYPFSTNEELMSICKKNSLNISQVMMANETVSRTKEEVIDGILNIWNVMDDSINKGLVSEEVLLPGSLKVPRRASKLYAKIQNQQTPNSDLNMLNVYSIAVNEENAAGSKVVTAPTNGAAGVIPAVLKYHLMLDDKNNSSENIVNYMLTTAAIGILFKKGASISAAEVGCQGEVGVACAMAAAGITELNGGDPYQVSNAAEIGMEHNLGLTCDPIGGLVQIPCIERNAMGSVQAVNASKLALLGDGTHVVSLDAVIATMKQTGKDMSSKYKETSQGGLAVNLPAC